MTGITIWLDEEGTRRLEQEEQVRRLKKVLLNSLDAGVEDEDYGVMTVARCCRELEKLGMTRKEMRNLILERLEFHLENGTRDRDDFGRVQRLRQAIALGISKNWHRLERAIARAFVYFYGWGGQTPSNHLILQ